MIMKKITYLSLFIWLLNFSSLDAATKEGVYSKNGMVVSRSSLASEIGIEIMRMGGNAVDSAVATAFALSVAYPSAGNLGGGGFALVLDSDGTVFSLDHREIAPSQSHRDMFLAEDGTANKDLSRRSRLAAGVPGSVDGLLELHKRFGKLDRKIVMEPSIKLAREGFLVDFFLGRHISRYGGRLLSNPAARKKFSVKGKLISEGDLWVQPDLAETLALISEKGRAGFYEGKVAGFIVNEMKKHNGIISESDLKNYRSVWRLPVKTDYREYEVWTMPPPSSGILILQMLNMIERFDLKRMGWGSSELVHLVIEAEKRAYADRAEYLGDPDFVEMPVKMLISKKYARDRFSDFDPKKIMDSEKISHGDVSSSESRETTHLSVMDSEGMVVALTTTLNSPYGSKIVIPGAGFLLNNEMDDFSIKPNVMNQFDLIGRKANEISPMKRMLSSMSPTILMKGGRPHLVTGSPGGSTIITTVFQVIMNFVDHEMPLHQAVGAPRFHHQWKPDRILYETQAFSPDTRKNLEALGYRNFVEWGFGGGIGDANSITMKDDRIYGVKDPRADGIASGF